MFIWNVGTTWWIWNASEPGAIAAFFANSLLMCLPWMGYKIAKKWLGKRTGYFSLIAFWMCFEYIHLHDWGLSWPWLTLGNAFATHPEWVQWYEYSGSSGGTLWVLLANIFIFLHLKEKYRQGGQKKFRTMVPAVQVLLFPVAISLLFFPNKTPEAQTTGNIVVVQPNIDPYEKVSNTTGSFEAQLQKLIRTTEMAADEHTTLMVWPETALYMLSGLDEATLKENLALTPLWTFLQQHPAATLFTGIESFRTMDQKTTASQEFNGTHYEAYNGSVLLDSSGVHGFYHKSMLVPGVETLPWFLKFLSKWFDKFGGTTAGYARQSGPTLLQTKNGVRIAPAICYESVYGEFLSRHIRNGASLICIVTNDGWWKKTPGHRQHMNYARLRAIETRTWVARSANTGISCFIDPYGAVYQPQPYNTQAAIKMNIDPVHSNTFFVRTGDILSKLMMAISVALLAWVITRKAMKRKPVHSTQGTAS